jgi:hypothetical protein
MAHGLRIPSAGAQRGSIRNLDLRQPGVKAYDLCAHQEERRGLRLC